MNRTTGMPVPPPERRLPDARRRREELLRMLDDEVLANTVRRRWLLPLGVAGAVTATGVAAVLAFGGGVTTKGAAPDNGPQAGGSPTTAASPGGSPTTAESPSTSPTLPSSLLAVSPHAKIFATGQACKDWVKPGVPAKAPDAGYTFGGEGGDLEHFYCFEVPTAELPPSQEPDDHPAITTGVQAPIPADQVRMILQSCVGDEAAAGLTPVLALRTAIPTLNQDGFVIAVDEHGRYVECGTLGEYGRSSLVPPYRTIALTSSHPGNTRIQEFDSGGDHHTTNGQSLQFDTGHYSSDVAKVTVSYGKDAKEYPAVMQNGVYFLSVSTPSQMIASIVHAYDTTGKEVFNTLSDTSK